jgi:replicative DNA helicase
VPLRQYLDEFWETPGIDSPFAGAIGAVRTGFMDLDTLLGGFHRSDLVICAARPSVGKSALLLNFARNARWGRTRALLSSPSRCRANSWERLLASESGVDGTRSPAPAQRPDEQRLMQATASTVSRSTSTIRHRYDRAAQAKLAPSSRSEASIWCSSTTCSQRRRPAPPHNRVQEVSEIRAASR